MKRKRAPDKPLISGTTALVKAGESTRFKPGVSPNPGGRPSYAALSAAYRQRLADPLDTRTARALKLHDGATVAQAIATVVINAALAGDIQAAREVCNRCEGLPPAFLGVAFNARPKVEYSIRVVEDPPKYSLPPTEQKLMDDLVSLIRTTPDDAIARQVAELARTLRKKYAAAKP